MCGSSSEAGAVRVGEAGVVMGCWVAPGLRLCSWSFALGRAVQFRGTGIPPSVIDSKKWAVRPYLLCGTARGGPGNFLDQAVDDLVAAHAGGFSAECGQNSVSQYGMRHLGDVVGGHMHAPLQDRTGLARQNEINAGTRPGTPLNQVVDVRRDARFTRARRGSFSVECEATALGL